MNHSAIGGLADAFVFALIERYRVVPRPEIPTHPWTPGRGLSPTSCALGWDAPLELAPLDLEDDEDLVRDYEIRLGQRGPRQPRRGLHFLGPLERAYHQLAVQRPPSKMRVNWYRGTLHWQALSARREKTLEALTQPEAARHPGAAEQEQHQAGADHQPEGKRGDGLEQADQGPGPGNEEPDPGPSSGG